MKSGVGGAGQQGERPVTIPACSFASEAYRRQRVRSFSVDEESVEWAKKSAAARGMEVKEVKILAMSGEHASAMAATGKEVPPLKLPGDIRSLSFADTQSLFDEIARHWSATAELQRIPLFFRIHLPALSSKLRNNRDRPMQGW